MVCPQVADGGDSLQIWRAAANILNKQLQIADKGWSSSFGVGHGSKNSKSKNKFVTECHKEPHTWTESLDKQPELRKMDVRFAAWDVR
jgi:hypothetical protein